MRVELSLSLSIAALSVMMFVPMPLSLSNINQIARKLNLGDLVLPSEFKEVQAEFETLWAYVLEGKKPKKQEEPQAEVSFPSASVEEHTCSKCGEVLKFKHSDKQCKDYWICPNYSKEDKGHTFEWVE